MGLAIVAFVLFAEPPLLTNPGSFEFDELVIFLIALAAVLFLAEIPPRAVVAKSQAVELLKIKHELSVQLGLALDWESLADLILAFCEATIELDGAVLLVRDPESSSFEVVAQLQTRENSDALKEAGPCSDTYCSCAVDATKY